MTDVPVDSLRQRIERLIDMIDSGSFGTPAFMRAELVSALELPDFDVEQQQRARATLDSLRHSGGQYRSKSVVQFTNDMLDWLEGFNALLAESVDRASAQLGQVEQQRRFYSREADRLREERDVLTAQRAAVREFFGVSDE